MEGKITKIEIQKNNKSRINVYLDGKYSFSCSADIAYLHSLKKDEIVDALFFSKIADEDNYIRCKQDGLKVIERSFKTEREVYDKLLSKGYEEKHVIKTISFLKDYDYVNDKKYVKSYVKEKCKMYGKKRIHFSLIKKGISKEIIEEIFKDYIDEAEMVYILANKKFDTLCKSEGNMLKLKNKLSNYLLRAGYEYSDIKAAVDKVCLKAEKSEETVIGSKANNCDDIEKIANKRYEILMKSEKDKRKIYSKLGQYLIRRGFEYEKVKGVLKKIIN